MKKLLIIFLFAGYLLNAQNQDIEELNIIKNNLSERIKNLNDSILIVNKKIATIESKQMLERASNSSLIAIAKKGSYLKKIPHVLGEIIFQLPENKNIIVTDYFNNYFGVCVDSICGYMSDMLITKNDNIRKFISIKNSEKLEQDRIQREQIAKERQIEKAELEKTYLKKYGKSLYEKLKKGYYWIGMTKEMAIISLGYPNDINRSVGSWGTHEQWVYSNEYLYFENGILKSYQD